MNDQSVSPGRLIVLEQGDTFVVASEDDPDDWVAVFTQDDQFPARDWAERMATLYNLRHDGKSDEESEHAPPFTGTHHPVVL